MEILLGTAETDGLVVEHVKRDDEYILAVEHFHSYHELYYLLSGHRTFFIQDKVFEVFAGSLVIIPAGQIHKIGPNENSAHERILLRIDTALLQQVDGFLEQEDLLHFFELHGGVMHFPKEHQQGLEKILLTMLQEFREKKPCYLANIKLMLASLFLYVLRYSHAQSMAPSLAFTTPQLQKVQEVAEYISANYQENIQLKDLESKFYVSRYHLCRIFKETTGFTVIEYLHTNRIVNAQRLLHRTDYTVTKIAQEVGYNSITQLNRKFKEISGMTPLEYRNGDVGEVAFH